MNSTLATPQISDLQLPLILERIFMPYATKQRDAAYKEQTGNSLYNGRDDDRLRFVHYTSAEAALSIIKTKRIWMRNTSCMSDYREVQHGFDILQRYFPIKNSQRTFAPPLTPARRASLKRRSKYSTNGGYIPRSVLS